MALGTDLLQDEDRHHSALFIMLSSWVLLSSVQQSLVQGTAKGLVTSMVLGVSSISRGNARVDWVKIRAKITGLEFPNILTVARVKVGDPLNPS